jgi:hypothetical protein
LPIVLAGVLAVNFQMEERRLFMNDAFQATFKPTAKINNDTLRGHDN